MCVCVRVREAVCNLGRRRRRRHHLRRRVARRRAACRLAVVVATPQGDRGLCALSLSVCPHDRAARTSPLPQTSSQLLLGVRHQARMVGASWLFVRIQSTAPRRRGAGVACGGGAGAPERAPERAAGARPGGLKLYRALVL